MTITYRVQAVSMGDVAKVIDQPFNTWAAAAKTRDYLRAKGYRAVVIAQVQEAA